jgi:hypothetical protein
MPFKRRPIGVRRCPPENHDRTSFQHRRGFMLAERELNLKRMPAAVKCAPRGGFVNRALTEPVPSSPVSYSYDAIQRRLATDDLRLEV